MKTLSRTLESAFGQTLARIREKVHSEQAFKILAWIRFIGPLPVDELRHALAVETHHSQFEWDNLPSAATFLDCCLGLVRVDSSQHDSSHNRVDLVHSTLDVYFDSHPTIIGPIAPVIARTCFIYLSFNPSERPELISSLMNDAWISVLCTVKKSPLS